MDTTYIVMLLIGFKGFLAWWHTNIIAICEDVWNEAMETSQASHVGECRKWRHLLLPRHFSNTRKEIDRRNCMLEEDWQLKALSCFAFNKVFNSAYLY